MHALKPQQECCTCMQGGNVLELGEQRKSMLPVLRVRLHAPAAAAADLHSSRPTRFRERQHDPTDCKITQSRA